MRWAKIAAAIVAFEFAAALAIGWSVGFQYQIPVAPTGFAGLAVAIIGTLCFVFVRVAWFAWLREPGPLRRIARELAAAPTFPVLIMLLSAQMAVLAWFKVTMPHAVGFWADPLLADLDSALFGRDPWRILHQAPDWVGALIDRVYAGWAFLGLAVLIILAFCSQSLRRDRALVSYFLLICIAGLFQYLLPSAGPVFYEAVGHGPRFGELPVRPWVQITADYLWSNYTGAGDRVGGGISAMPSVHVGAGAWIALTFRAYFPRLRFAGWAYVATLFFGSVYLGWHYAVDGIAGIAICAWMLASLLLSKASEQTLPVMTPQTN